MNGIVKVEDEKKTSSDALHHRRPSFVHVTHPEPL